MTIGAIVTHWHGWSTADMSIVSALQSYCFSLQDFQIKSSFNIRSIKDFGRERNRRDLDHDSSFLATISFNHFNGVASFHQLAILSTCQFVNLPFCQLAILTTCRFINFPFHQFAISSTYYFVNLPFGFWTTYHFVNLPFCQLDILSTCHFINLTFHQLAILSTYYFVNLPVHQFAILSTCNFINLLFGQLVIL